MTIAAYGQFTARGIAKLAAQRAKQIDAECRAVQKEPAPVAVPVAEKEVVASPEQEALRFMRRRGIPLWARSIVVSVAERHGVDVMRVFARTRRRTVTTARNEIWYHLKTGRSSVTGASPSFTQIGMWFGRDHSSVTWGAAKHAFDNGLPSPSGLDPERLITRKRDRALEWAKEKRGEA